MTMTFKEALIAHLQGQKVEAKHVSWRGFIGFDSSFAYSTLKDFVSINFDDCYTFRLAPRTILVNGVEVPAGEKEAPADDAEYFVPQFLDIGAYEALYWKQDELDARLLERGLVYLDKESAIARAKAMLITQEVK